MPKRSFKELNDKILTYEASLDNLDERTEEQPNASELNEYKLCVLKTLLARTELYHALARNQGPTLTEMSKIIELDKKLKGVASEFANKLEPPVFDEWRSVIPPNPDLWWWHLDGGAAPTSHPVPLITTLFFVSVAISIAFRTIALILNIAVDFIGILSTLFPAIVVLLAGSTYTDLGRQAIKRFNARFRSKRETRYRWGLALAAVLVLLAMLLSTRIPERVARYHIAEGVRLDESERPRLAKAKYQDALRLLDSGSPLGVEAKARLARACYNASEWDKAIEHYRDIVHSAPTDSYRHVANLNIAHINIWKNDKAAETVAHLNALLAERPLYKRDATMTKVNFRSGLLDYTFRLILLRGWAYLTIGDLESAESAVKEVRALGWENNGEECLMATVADAQSKLADVKGQVKAEAANKVARDEWKACSKWASDQLKKSASAVNTYPPADEYERSLWGSWLNAAKKHLPE